MPATILPFIDCFLDARHYVRSLHTLSHLILSITHSLEEVISLQRKLSNLLKIRAGKRRDQEPNPGLPDLKALLPNHSVFLVQWQRRVQPPLDSRNNSWQVHGDRSDVCPASLGAEISMVGESISTLANAFTLVDRNLLEFQSSYQPFYFYKWHWRGGIFFLITRKIFRKYRNAQRRKYK